MEHSKYNQMIHEQEQRRSNAWRFIFDAWTCAEWRPLPREIKILLALPESIGVCSGQLVTRTGALGMIEFINRMNNRKDKTS